MKTAAGRHAVECLEKGYTPAMSKEGRKKIDGEKTRVTLKASTISIATDEGKTGERGCRTSFVERLAKGNAAEPEGRFDGEEMGDRLETQRYRGEDASEALRWQRVSAVLHPDTATDCTGL
jgi:hypothetical protein